MNMYRRLICFWRDRRAAAGAEFALLSIVFAGILLGIIDFNRLLYETNRLEKACQVGVRFAVMNDMVATSIANWNDDNICAGGLPIPPGAPGNPPIECNGTSCDSGGYNSNAYQIIVDEMGSIFGRLTSDPNAVITVTYENIQQGFCGNPFGPDIWPLTTVDVTGMQFEFATPFVSAVAPIDLECSATMTGEDFNTCENNTGAPWCS
jgi:hypothetical protein